MSNNHDCVKRINEQLRESNLEMPLAISLGNTGRELIQVAIVKRHDAPRGTKLMSLFASYCPFCGKKLDPQ